MKVYRSYEKDDFIIIIPEGEIDVTNSTEFKNRILEEFVEKGKSNIIVDMSNVGYMDSSALGTIISLYKNCRMNGGGLAIAGLVDSVRRLFSITALDKVIPIYETIDDAIKHMK
jgi:anti-sigma B factor antagonist